MPYCKICRAKIQEGLRICPYCGSDPNGDLSDDPMVGRTVAGKFQVLELLGTGGMGKVYKARQVILDRPVVLKILHEHFMRQPKLVKRFEREARAASRLDHPNTIRIIDSGRDPSGVIYMAMEFLDGKDLAALIHEQSPMDEKRIRRLGVQICAALEEAHKKNIVHRDLKPENIMVVADQKGRELVKVLDFGIAKILDLDETRTQALTQAGSVCGTPEYMSPEQARGESLDGRTDIFALGVVLYQMATGSLPFPADTPMAVVAKNLLEEPEPPSKRLGGGISPGLDAIILKAMEKDPKRRFQSAAEMAAALEALEYEDRVSNLETGQEVSLDVDSEIMTLVIVDIVGFTARTSGQSREENARFLESFEGLVIPLLHVFKGRNVKGLGDGYLLAFQSPTNALLFAMALQDAVYESSAEDPSKPLVIRVAVHTGEVRVHRGDVLGEPVNLAARLESVTPAGEIWFTESVYLSMTRSEIPSLEVGKRILKGITEAVRIYRVPRQDPGESGKPPFRELGLDRARAMGWRPGRPSGLARLLRHARQAVVRRGWIYAAAALLLVVSVIAAGDYWYDREGGDNNGSKTRPWLETAARTLEAGDPVAALNIIEDANEPLGAQGMVIKARALLGLKKPRVEEATGLLAAAIAMDPDLADEKSVQAALVACLDTKSPSRIAALISKHESKAMVERLDNALKSSSYTIRHNALKTLENMNLGTKDRKFRVYYQDLSSAKSCRARKAAVKVLAELEDPRALPLLYKVRKAGLFRNLCMMGLLKKAIIKLERAKKATH